MHGLRWASESAVIAEAGVASSTGRQGWIVWGMGMGMAYRGPNYVYM